MGAALAGLKRKAAVWRPFAQNRISQLFYGKAPCANRLLLELLSVFDCGGLKFAISVAAGPASLLGLAILR
jgi:hypothetical protein